MVSKFLISVNPGDPLPIYRQIVEQVKGAIVSGLLKGGDKLPSHRELAREILIAPLTVKKAYDTLESEKLIEFRRGRGTFVSEGVSEMTTQGGNELESRAQGLVVQARLLGFEESDLLKLINQTWKKTSGDQNE